jgi:hypothetical protein
MSFAEMKERVKELTPEEREELALHLEFLRQTNDPELRTSAHRAASGRLYTEEEVEAVHQRLIRDGL